MKITICSVWEYESELLCGKSWHSDLLHFGSYLLQTSESLPDVLHREFLKGTWSEFRKVALWFFTCEVLANCRRPSKERCYATVIPRCWCREDKLTAMKADTVVQHVHFHHKQDVRIGTIPRLVMDESISFTLAYYAPSAVTPICM